jgi:plasmid maintenance system antidote protein VapI
VTVNQRIVEIYKSLNITPAEFSRVVNVPHSRLNNQILGKNGVGLDTIQSIVKSLQNLNPRWLLLGNGEMWISENSNIQITDILESKIIEVREDNTEYKRTEKSLLNTDEVMKKQIELLLVEMKRMNIKMELMEKEVERLKKGK